MRKERASPIYAFKTRSWCRLQRCQLKIVIRKQKFQPACLILLRLLCKRDGLEQSLCHWSFWGHYCLGGAVFCVVWPREQLCLVDLAMSKVVVWYPKKTHRRIFLLSWHQGGLCATQCPVVPEHWSAPSGQFPQFIYWAWGSVVWNISSVDWVSCSGHAFSWLLVHLLAARASETKKSLI